MPKLIEHTIVIDEGECFNTGHAKFRAYCTEECGWQGEAWWHACTFADNADKHPDDAAHEAAEDEGAEHLRDVGAAP